jgi:hypothetical protein
VTIDGTLSLQQDGNNVTGSFTETGVPVSGVVDGDHLALDTAAFVNTVSGAVITGTLDGTVNGNSMNLSGVAKQTGPAASITLNVSLVGTRTSN